MRGISFILTVYSVLHLNIRTISIGRLSSFSAIELYIYLSVEEEVMVDAVTVHREECFYPSPFNSIPTLLLSIITYPNYIQSNVDRMNGLVNQRKNHNLLSSCHTNINLSNTLITGHSFLHLLLFPVCNSSPNSIFSEHRTVKLDGRKL